MTDFMMTQEHRILKGNVAELCRKEFAPLAAHIDQTASFPRENLRKLAEQGFAGMNVPEEFGGSGADTLSFVLVIEEIAKVAVPRPSSPRQ